MVDLCRVVACRDRLRRPFMATIYGDYLRRLFAAIIRRVVACGSTSGGVDIRPFPDNWKMKDALGNYNENSEQWDHHTVIKQLHLVKPGLAIIIDCVPEVEKPYSRLFHGYIFSVVCRHVFRELKPP